MTTLPKGKTNPKEDDSSTSSASTPPSSSNSNNKRMQALEAKAVAEATATADAQFVPSVSLMNSSDPNAILEQVDGLRDLSDYQDKDSVYVGRSVPITAGGSLEIPIQVGTPGNVVEYAVENKQYDFGFSITAERDESVTIVKVRNGAEWKTSHLRRLLERKNQSNTFERASYTTSRSLSLSSSLLLLCTETDLDDAR